jgi:hypothetical protein
MSTCTDIIQFTVCVSMFKLFEVASLEIFVSSFFPLYRVLSQTNLQAELYARVGGTL